MALLWVGHRGDSTGGEVAAPLWVQLGPRAASPWLLEALQWDYKSSLLPSQVLSV